MTILIAAGAGVGRCFGSLPRAKVSMMNMRALEAAGVEFTDENGGGPGVRLRKSGKQKPIK
jgi:hypothetical protein